ncbi:MAG: hypothetical protein IMZ69_09095 [Spirochaetes bacterium]|nr:hypothetical protein [Spirochaetota bacterium]
MTTHYLLLSGPLVPSALDGRKTQTRRIVAWSNSYVDGSISNFWREHWHQLNFSRAWVDGGPSPAGNPGPYLHVPIRAGAGDTTHRVYPRYQVGDRLIFKETWQETHDGIIYRAGENWPKDRVWKSARFMPARAARSINRITEVRGQRLQEISYEDIRAEGWPIVENGNALTFPELWDSLNAKRGYSWESNPYVWALTFEREE